MSGTIRPDDETADRSAALRLRWKPAVRTSISSSTKKASTPALLLEDVGDMKKKNCQYFPFLCSPLLSLTTLLFPPLLFPSLVFTSAQFTLLHFTSIYIPSFHLTSLHFTSLHFTSLHFNSLRDWLSLSNISIIRRRGFRDWVPNDSYTGGC